MWLFPECSPVIWGAPRVVACITRCTHACCQHWKTWCGHLEACHCAMRLVAGTLSPVAGAWRPVASPLRLCAGLLTVSVWVLSLVTGSLRHVPSALRLVTGALRLVASAMRHVACAPGRVAGALSLVVGTPRCVAGACRCSPASRQTTYIFSGFCQYSQVHLKATALVQSTRRFDHPGIVIQQPPNTPSDNNKFCWCSYPHFGATLQG